MSIKFNSPLMNFLTIFINYIILNIIFMICCIPIFTIGPSITALYYVSLKEIRNESGYMLRDFFYAFRKNFRQSFLCGLIYLVAFLILGFILLVWYYIGGYSSLFIVVLIGIVLLILLSGFFYTFPIITRFESSSPIAIMRNSIGIAYKHRITTLILFFLHAIILVPCYYFQQSRLFFIIIGYSFLSYCSSYLIQKIFTIYESKESDETQL